jgi:hypothetical protein
MDNQTITALNVVLGNSMNGLVEENKRLTEENKELMSLITRVQSNNDEMKEWFSSFLASHGLNDFPNPNPNPYPDL